MPLYEYRCAPCDRIFETLIRSSGDQPRCPECSSVDVEKLLSVPAAVQTANGGSTSMDRQTADSSSFGCGRPQCGSGMWPRASVERVRKRTLIQPDNVPYVGRHSTTNAPHGCLPMA